MVCCILIIARIAVIHGLHVTGNFHFKQQIYPDLLPEFLVSIVVECHMQNINRQDWIKMVCVENLRAIQSSRIANTV